MICFGVFVAFLMGNFFIPYQGTPEEATSNGWKVVFGFPAVFALIQIILIKFVFTIDSPKYYALIKDRESINAFEAKIYLDPLDGEDSEELIEEPEQPSIVAKSIENSVLSNKNFKAFIIAFILSPLIQLSGCNAITLYSNTIFSSGGEGLGNKEASA
jgi:hypothetical protein